MSMFDDIDYNYPHAVSRIWYTDKGNYISSVDSDKRISFYQILLKVRMSTCIVAGVPRGKGICPLGEGGFMCSKNNLS